MFVKVKVDMFDYNVEFAHIYSDEQFSKEQLLSIERAKVVAKDIAAKKAAFVVLVDNYNPKEVDALNIQDYISTVEKFFSSKIAFVALEADLCKGAMALHNEMQGRLQKSYGSYIEKRKKIPCSLLTAYWYLVRLGVYSPPQEFDREWRYSAKRIINILPDKYIDIEKKTCKIIENTKHKNVVGKIESIFFNI